MQVWLLMIFLGKIPLVKKRGMNFKAFDKQNQLDFHKN